MTAKLPLFPRGRGKALGKECAMTTFINMLRDEAGASAAEYALILAIVGAAIAVAAVLLGGAISTAMNNARACIENPPTSSGGTC
jgi:pilus assembly protein Flp/PilA